MYLKSLTPLRFKSFADKTSLNFQLGVTAIIGPPGGLQLEQARLLGLKMIRSLTTQIRRVLAVSRSGGTTFAISGTSGNSQYFSRSKRIRQEISTKT
jgi:hypothetical protein